MVKRSIDWPAVIRHPDDPELTCVRSQSVWDSEADLHSFEYDDSDYLVDSSGIVYTLTRRTKNVVQPEPDGRSLALEVMLGLVKAHASQTGSCCVSKLYAPSIREAIRIVESLDEA
jgi:hypothetical protein